MSQFARGSLPGHGEIFESVETQVQFLGINGEMNANVSIAVIDSTSQDAGNTPATTLRGGLVMGKVSSSNQHKPYDPTATDGTQNAAAILLDSVDMLDPYGSAEDKYTGRVVTSGNIVRDSVIGLTPIAEQQLIAQGVRFDETPMPMASSLLAHNGVIYADDDVTLTAADSGKMIAVTKAGAFEATLPSIEEGLEYTFIQTVDQNMAVSSVEGDNVLAMNNASADGVIFSTASQKIGARCTLKAIRTATDTLKWLAVKNGVGFTMTTVSA